MGVVVLSSTLYSMILGPSNVVLLGFYVWSGPHPSTGTNPGASMLVCFLVSMLYLNMYVYIYIYI